MNKKNLDIFSVLKFLLWTGIAMVTSTFFEQKADVEKYMSLGILIGI